VSETSRVTVKTDVMFGRGGGRELRCNLYLPSEPDAVPAELEPPGVAGSGVAGSGVAGSGVAGSGGAGSGVAGSGGVPGQQPGERTAVILVHGGGWRSGEPEQLHGYGILLGRAGFVCIAPEYRLLGESPWPAAIHDVKSAIRWVRAHAGELGVDPDRIVIEGNSAGGHLALLAAGTPGHPVLDGDDNLGVSSEVAAVIGVYAPSLFFQSRFERGGVPFLALTDSGDDAGAALASPRSHVGPDFPPTMLIHGTHDALVPLAATLTMHEALLAAKVPASMHIYAEQPHAFDRDQVFGRQCVAEMVLFLDHYVRNRAPSLRLGGTVLGATVLGATVLGATAEPMPAD
jgi:acetyl esterase/lipase